MEGKFSGGITNLSPRFGVWSVSSGWSKACREQESFEITERSNDGSSGCSAVSRPTRLVNNIPTLL